MNAEAPALPPYPSLKAQHVTGARLFADREDMIRDIGIAPGGKIAEIGVMRGDFSVFMLKHLKPSRFVAFDIFTCHEYPTIWGKPSSELFGGTTQLECFKRMTAEYKDIVAIEEGRTEHTMPKHGGHSFDMVYIDASHDYQDVKSDAELAAKMVKPGGLLVFNDYIIYDHLLHTTYGIVPVVNEMVVNQGWHITGFALKHDMFCDIAIRKI